MLVQDDGEAMSLLNEFTENVSNKDSPFQTVMSGVATEVRVLISQSYRNFGHITMSHVENLRNSERLRVVQSIEDQDKKSVMRSVKGITSFKQPEIDFLYRKFQECRRKMSLCSSKVRHLSGSFVIDESQFCELFSLASPWGVGCLATALASRIFLLLDTNKDGLVEFHEMVFCYDVICNGSLSQRLKLFYLMHLDDRVPVTMATPITRITEKRGSDGSSVGSSDTGSGGLVSQSSTDSEPDPAAMTRVWKSVGIRRYPQVASPFLNVMESTTLPDIKQRQFIQLWKSLYGLYSDDYSNVIEVYSAIGRLGALLTKIGEGREKLPEDEVGEEALEVSVDTLSIHDNSKLSSLPSPNQDQEWELPFRTVFTAFQTEQNILEFFQRVTPIDTSLR
eukprot:sb/3465488/